MVVPLLLALLAVWRLARLITTDFLTEPIRNWVSGYDAKTESEQRPRLGYLFSCPWCMSIWIAAPVIWPALWWPDNRAVLLVLAALTASGVAGMLATIEDRLDR